MGETVNLLLVDDEERNLDVLESILASTGCSFVRAKSAEEALLALLHHEFAAIVLDIKMPGTSGLELARIIKARKRTQHVPILFLTAHILDEKDIVHAYDAGGVDYLIKPVNPDILRSKVGVFVDLFRTTRALGNAVDALHSEIAEREKVQEELHLAKEELETRVLERTAELDRANREIRNNEERLRLADRRKDEFLATLAHELRNPLAPIRYALQVVNRTGPSATELQWAIGVIERQTQHMARLVNDLLDVNRITRNTLELRPERVELARIINAVTESSRPLIKGNGHELSVRLPANPVYLDADVVRLAQVFSNLLHNAAKYGGKGPRERGRISLTAVESGNKVIVTVKDSGIGIAPSMLPRVFEMFTQVGRSLEQTEGGLGIGLSLAKRLVEMHGGTIEARSEGLGQGSEFVVTLPVVSRVAPAETAQRPTPPGRTAKRRILVADDNPDVTEAFQVMLQTIGHEVEIAHDGIEALDKAARFRPEIVVLDVGMPKMNGYDAARQLRQQPWAQDVVLIAVTGWGNESDKRETAEAGFDVHLVKPVDPVALGHIMDSVRPVRPVRPGSRLAAGDLRR